MIIKTAIKHYIFEACINVVFSTIRNNFGHPNDGIPKIGELYSKVIYNNTTYYNCVITGRDETHYSDKYPHNWTFVLFEYNEAYIDGIKLNPSINTAHVSTRFFRFIK